MWLHLFLLLLVQLFARAVGDAADQSGEVNCDNSTIIRGLWDAKEPVGVSLCGVYKKGPAYNRLAYRMPPFLSKLIDWLIRDREEIAEKYGADSLEELEHIVENIRKMKNEVETNQPLTPLPLAHSEADRDIEEWNNYLEARREMEGPNLSWYLTRFLLSETYHYRRIIQEFAVTKYLKNFDPYEKQKRSIFENSIMSSAILARETMRELNGSTKAWNEEEKSRELAKFLKLSLWGNRLDLAESGGNDVSQAGDPIKMLNSLEEDLLVDDTRVVWDILKKPQGSNDPVIVDIVLDNAGYELFTDLCLASFLVTRGLASKVRFYVKEIPWYVSDVTLHDFYWIIEYMRNSSVPDLKEFGDLCVLQLERGDWTVVVDPFWTTFYDFGAMKKQAPALYEKLSEATLVIFKGDLNYRKLLGDINWEYTTSLDLALFHQDFKPSNVVTQADVNEGRFFLRFICRIIRRSIATVIIYSPQLLPIILYAYCIVSKYIYCNERLSDNTDLCLWGGYYLS